MNIFDIYLDKIKNLVIKLNKKYNEQHKVKKNQIYPKHLFL